MNNEDNGQSMPPQEPTMPEEQPTEPTMPEQPTEPTAPEGGVEQPEDDESMPGAGQPQ